MTASKAEVQLAALEIFRGACSAPSPDLAVRNAVLAAEEVTDVRTLQRIAAYVAVVGVWELGPARPRTADEIRCRLRRVRAWVGRVQLEAMWNL